MKQIFLFLIIIFTCIFGYSQKRTISYSGTLDNGGALLSNKTITLLVSIIKGSASGSIIYSESQTATTDSTGKYNIEIGAGHAISGGFDSIIWSDGIFYLRTEVDPAHATNQFSTRNILMRIPVDLAQHNEQGTVTSSDHPDWGSWKISNTQNKRPRLITIDLTTSYANLSYPGDTYPIYRHYEWCDPDRDGSGNSFSITYSDFTNNYFRENTTKLGEVKLYQTAFQELILSSTPSDISVSITKPIPVSSKGETYAIKGPWKFIWYVEW